MLESGFKHAEVQEKIHLELEMDLKNKQLPKHLNVLLHGSVFFYLKIIQYLWQKKSDVVLSLSI